MSSSISTNNRTSSNNETKELYIYELPPRDRNDLCAILDELDVWSLLATEHMKYSNADLQAIKRAVARGCSPSNELLNMWGDLNHTVTELFVLLYRMQQYNAMDAIKSSVDPKYHKLITLGQPDLTNLMQKSKSVKILNCKNSSSGFSNSNNESTRSDDDYTSSTTESKDDSDNWKIKNVKEYASTIPQIDYKELLQATDDWNEKNILGKGGFGTVYKGCWKFTTVAIKRITYNSPDGGEKIQIQQSLNELKHLNSCRHDNILPLYGYSINGADPCLVYQLMSGGSLEWRLNTKNLEPLSWKQRLNIACGTARGLQYLHTFREKPLIHGDIKPANILLDPCNQPRIGDFGLAREGHSQDSSMEVSRVFGTRPYLPLEFSRYKSLSTKVDTFSYGVVLLEMFTGLRAYEKNRPHPLLTEHILTALDKNIPIEELIDKTLRVNADVEQLCKHVINLGTACISQRPEHRPEMVTVLKHLENL
ncbi:serine/threonine-protein kinase pelle [Episyrphus balteatus]|uniref:serine/threonine-protein kinase pelle n=1 Tax=Episyrphus balteatus TaxID=286459 RepID=UPI002485664F|nr:serine/threonine-protein kinase pelle [Episyrphus balteatus]